MAISLQVGYDQGNFFPRGLHLFRRATEFELCTTGEDLEQGKLLFENVELSIVYAEELDRVDGFQVDDCVGQFASILIGCCPQG